MQEEYDISLICPECWSRSVMYLRKHNMMECRRCGNKWSKDIKKEDIDLTKAQLQPICPRCASMQVMYTSKDNSLNCRRCGKKWPRENHNIIH